jgi:FkbM family methyltransferase
LATTTYNQERFIAIRMHPSARGIRIPPEPTDTLSGFTTQAGSQVSAPSRGITLIKKLAQGTLKKFGLRIVRDSASPHSMALAEDRRNWFFTAIKGLGFCPKHIIDVGANRGAWTRTAFSFFPQTQYTLLEPQDHLKAHIQDLVNHGCKVKWISAGVADTPGELPFTIAYRDDSSSFAPTKNNSGSSQVMVPVTTLNEIVASSNASFPEMVKIDAEGFDLKVLAGASELLGKTDIFLVEAAVWCPGLENTVAEAVRGMDNAGYGLADVTDMNRSPKFGVLWLCELAFLRKASPLWAGVTSFE